jgi:hypothetical protein
MKNISGKTCKKIKTHFMSNNFFPTKIVSLGDNVEKYGTPRQATDDNSIGRMRFACWITKATYVSSEYVILLASPRQEWFREHTSMFHCTYTACLVRYEVRGKIEKNPVL